MKKSILSLAAITLLSGIILTSCNSSAEKVENAKNDAKEANGDLDKANQEYMVDIESYRKETAGKIAANQKSIDAFNERISKEKKEARENYKMKIAELEQKNTDMKKRMDDYKEEGKEKWETFKTELNRDMDALGHAFNNLTVKNVK